MAKSPSPSSRKPASRPSPTDAAAARNRLGLRVHLRLASCRNLLMREARKSIDQWSLTLPQFDVLAELARTDERGFTFIELSRLLLVTSGNLTGIVDRLERDKLVRREPAPDDRRVIRVKLTPKGRTLTDDMLPRHADDIHDVLSGMPREQITQLVDLLGNLRDYLRKRDGDERHPAPSASSDR
jgi:DNA-binding MarR family transcriptional regulator